MNIEQAQQYLERIKFDTQDLQSIEQFPINVKSLFALQQAHLQTVPYENLDVVFTNPPAKLHLALDELFDKIVKQKRGGICYELNFLYTDLLRTLGFDTHIIAAQVKETGTEFDHVAMLVEGLNEPTQNSATRNDSPSLWLTDVGFGHASALPLEFAIGKLQDDGRDQFCFFEIEQDGETWYELGRSEGMKLSENDPISKDAFERAFAFRMQYREPEEFLPRSTYYATDDSSVFRSGPIVSIDNGEERTTLSGHHFIQTTNGIREERDIEYPQEFEQLLQDVFDIHLNEPVPDLP